MHLKLFTDVHVRVRNLAFNQCIEWIPFPDESHPQEEKAEVVSELVASTDGPYHPGNEEAPEAARKDSNNTVKSNIPNQRAVVIPSFLDFIFHVILHRNRVGI